jgi:hypothetical protein
MSFNKAVRDFIEKGNLRDAISAMFANLIDREVLARIRLEMRQQEELSPERFNVILDDSIRGVIIGITAALNNLIGGFVSDPITRLRLLEDTQDALLAALQTSPKELIEVMTVSRYDPLDSKPTLQ